MPWRKQMNRQLRLPLMLAMTLIILDLGLSMALQNRFPIPLTDMDWLNELKKHPFVFLYHLDALNLIIAWVFAIFFVQLKRMNVRYDSLFILYGVGLILMTMMNRAFIVWILSQYTTIQEASLLTLIHQGHHDAWWTLPGFLLQNISFLTLACYLVQNKTSRMLGILACLGFSVLSVYLVLIRFIALSPGMMGLAAVGGILALIFYGGLIKHLQSHSI